jgi:hypothetical protein
MNGFFKPVSTSQRPGDYLIKDFQRIVSDDKNNNTGGQKRSHDCGNTEKIFLQGRSLRPRDNMYQFDLFVSNRKIILLPPQIFAPA